MKNFKDNKSFGSRGSFGGDKRGGGFDRGRGGFSGGNRPSFGGGRPSYGGNRSSFGGDRQSEVFKATCADCQKSCEVPFRPSGDRPVFCSDCFGEKRGASEDTRSNFESRSTYRDAAKPAAAKPSVDLSVVLAKLDTLIAAVEKLTAAQKEFAQPVVAEVATEEAVAPKAKKVAKKPVAEKKPAKKVAAKKK